MQVNHLTEEIKNKFLEYSSDKSFFEAIKNLSNDKNVEVYLVGGFVRDFILGKKRNKIEYDLLVVGSGIDFAKDLAKELNVASIVVYKNFGVAYFKYENFSFEFVGARKESYNRNSRKPIVENGTFEDDIYRRDFTINALALSLNKKNYGDIIDILGGLNDIENRIIKTPLDPEKTFSDDPLRMLRAIRFASELNFTIDDNTFFAIKRMKERIKIISQERISDEFLKIIASDKPSIGLRLLQESGLNEIIFPELHRLSGVEQRQDYHHKDVFNHTLMVVDNISSIKKNNENFKEQENKSESDDLVWLRIAALLHDIGKPIVKKFEENIGWTFHGHEEVGARIVKKIFYRMRWPLEKADYVEKLVRLHMRPISLVDDVVTDRALRRLITQAGEHLNDLITLCRADITSHNPNRVKKFLQNYDAVVEKILKVEETDKLSSFKCPIDGETIMKICNIPPSPKVGLLKKAVEEAIIDGQIENSREAALNYLLHIKDKILVSIDKKITLLFASYNKNKYLEIKDILKKTNLDIVCLSDFEKKIVIIENGNTFEENALIKAKRAFEEFKIPSFADDSGLEVEALNGAPGVQSARYAGENANDEANLAKLLNEIKSLDDPIKARFVCCVAFYDGFNEYSFWGELKGKLIKTPKGSSGFGYDPIFVPNGLNITLAQMSSKSKNKISHRSKAIWNFAEFLLTKYLGGQNEKQND